MAEDPKTPTTSALKCEKELIPVLAGECRASPITMPIEKSLIRSSSAEVREIALKFIKIPYFRMPWIGKGNQMNTQNLEEEGL